MFFLVMLILSAFFAGLVLQTPYVPCVDVPAHLALVKVMQTLGTPDHIVSRTFAWGVFPAPNSLFYFLCYCLSPFLGLLKAAKIVVVGTMIALPWAAAFFASTFGRNRLIAIAMFPLLIHWPFAEGFIDYCLGLPLVLVALSLLQRYLRAPSKANEISVVLMGPMVFFTHVQAFLYYSVGAALLLTIHFWLWRKETVSEFSMRRIFRVLLAVGASSLGITVLWYVRARSQLSGRVIGGHMPIVDIEEKLHELFIRSYLLISNNKDAWSIVALGFSLAFFVFFSKYSVRAVPDSTARQHPFPGWFLLTLCVLYIAAPISIGTYHNLHNRIPAFAGMIAVLWLAPPASPSLSFGRSFKEWTCVPLIFSALLAVWAFKGGLSEWKNYTRGFKAVLSAAPKQSRLAFLPQLREPTGFNTLTWRHLGQYHTVLNEGTTSFSFGIQPGRVVQQRNLDFKFEYLERRSVKEAFDGSFDVLLHKGAEKLEEVYPINLQLIERRRLWSLYKITADIKDSSSTRDKPDLGN